MSTERVIYTAADFGRYHSGKMSAAEMHDLERAALRDPFIEDALEGYANTTTGEEDVASIRKKLASKKTPVVEIRSNYNGLWWKVAAMVILICGLGFVTYKLSNNYKDERLAENRQPASAAPDTATLNVSEQAGEADLAKASTSVTSDKPIKISGETNSGIVGNSESVEKKALIKPAAALPYTMEGKVVDEKGRAMADVTITNNEDMVVTRTDKLGNYSIKASEPSVESVVVSGYGTQRKKLETNNANVVVLDKNADMVTNNASLPNNAIASAKMKAKDISAKRMQSKAIQQAVPQGGMVLYEAYLRNNLKPVTDENGLRYIGKVRLQFDLSEEGKPQNINLLQSLCAECDQQAISLLKNGVNWEGGTGKRYELEVQF